MAMITSGSRIFRVRRKRGREATPRAGWWTGLLTPSLPSFGEEFLAIYPASRRHQRRVGKELRSARPIPSSARHILQFLSGNRYIGGTAWEFKAAKTHCRVGVPGIGTKRGPNKSGVPLEHGPK
jgi:hypothetical protein